MKLAYIAYMEYDETATGNREPEPIWRLVATPEVVSRVGADRLRNVRDRAVGKT